MTASPPPKPVPSVRLTQVDMTAALLAYWNRRDGGLTGTGVLPPALLTLATGWMFFSAFTAARPDLMRISVWAFLGGIGLRDLVAMIIARSRRRQDAANAWEDYAEVPSPLSMYETADGIHFVGNGYDRVLKWLDVRMLLLTPDRRIWVAVTRSRAVFWVPQSAFADRGGFESFTKRASREWKSCRSVGRAFEVLPLAEKSA